MQFNQPSVRTRTVVAGQRTMVETLPTMVPE
jgi:hypothetical protein